MPAEVSNPIDTVTTDPEIVVAPVEEKLETEEPKAIDTQIVTGEVSEAYPAPESGAAPAGYPEPNETTAQAYPPPVSAIQPRATSGILFSINPNTKSGDTIVQGTAPPNLAIAIVNITLNGEILGFGRSNAEGSFEINLSPLEPSRRIGIALAELEDGVTFDERVEELFPYRGEQFMNLPNVGVYFDTLMIE